MRTCTLILVAMMAMSVGKLSAQNILPEEAQRRVEERAEQIRQKKAYDDRVKELAKGEDKSMREARKQLQKEADIDRKRTKLDYEVKQVANVTGCDEQVFVHHRAVEYDKYATQTTVRILNAKDFPMNIETSYKAIGVAVGNLCPDGSVTLSFVLKYPETMYHQSVNIYLTAAGKDDSGTRFTQMYQISLSDYSRYNWQDRNYQRDDRVWEIR